MASNTIQIPESYAELPVKDIKISHYPEDAPTATPVIIVSLNRPNKHNAFTIQMMQDLELCYSIFDLDERVKCVVLTGSGKTFCAGADLDIGFPGGGQRAKPERPKDHRDGGGRVTLAIHRCRKPTIVALNGSAVGVGMTMTLAATIRIAHAGSKYGFVFGRRGIVMEACSSYFLPRLVGYSTAMYLVSTGDTYRGDSKHLSSLFQEVVEAKEDVLKRALQLASDIAENVSGMASHLSRQLMWRGPQTAEEAHLLDSSILSHVFTNPDCAEGVQSFMEKRKPKFTATLEEDGPPHFPWWSDIDTRGPTRATKAKL